MLTGSLDETIVVWHRKELEVLRQVVIGGGVWRMEVRDNFVAVACMYGGAKVLRLDALEVQAHY